MRADYHMHLEPDDHVDRAPYTVERIETYVRAASLRGVEEIGITEHMHRFSAFAPMMRAIAEERRYPEQARWMPRYFTEDLDVYVNAVLRAKERGLPVKLSIEVDYLPGDEERLAEILDQYPWDYVLGSVHFLGTWGVDWSIENGWAGRDIDNVYERYFQTLRDAARSGLFDVLAHPDLIKKFGHRPKVQERSASRGGARDEGERGREEVAASAEPEAGVARAGGEDRSEASASTPGESNLKRAEGGLPRRWLTETVRTIADHGVCVEVSTAGLHKPVGEIYPSSAFLRRCREEGVPITLASDAHIPEHIGRDFDAAVQWAKDAGYEWFTKFNGGRRLRQPL